MTRRRPKEGRLVVQKMLPALSSATEVLSEIPYQQGLAPLHPPLSSPQQRVDNLAKINGQLGATLQGCRWSVHLLAP